MPALEDDPVQEKTPSPANSGQHPFFLSLASDSPASIQPPSVPPHAVSARSQALSGISGVVLPAFLMVTAKRLWSWHLGWLHWLTGAQSVLAPAWSCEAIGDPQVRQSPYKAAKPLTSFRMGLAVRKTYL